MLVSSLSIKSNNKENHLIIKSNNKKIYLIILPSQPFQFQLTSYTLPGGYFIKDPAGSSLREEFPQRAMNWTLYLFEHWLINGYKLHF